MRKLAAFIAALGACSDASAPMSDSGPSDVTTSDTAGGDDAAPDATSDAAPDATSDATSDAAPDALAEDLLAGPSDAAALSVLPAVAIPLPDEAAVIDVDVLSLVRDRVVLALADDATVGDVNALALALDARLVGTSPELGLLVLAPRDRTADLSWVGRALALADASSAIDVAAPSAIEAPQLVPPLHVAPIGWSWADDTGPDWGLHAIRAPLAWNLRHHLVAPGPHVVVLDGAFNPHPDVTFDAATPLRPAAEDTHGTSVAGVIAAHWDAVGIEGVVPVPTTVRGRTATTLPYPAENALAVIVAELASARADGVPLVVNMSLGHNLYRVDRRPDGRLVLAYQHRIDEEVPQLGESFAQIAERTGRLLRRLSRYTASGGGYDRWLMVCSAGNSNVNAARKAEAAAANIDLALADVRAQYNSGCAFAAAEGDAHFMSVEALATGGQGLADFSSRGGTIAAPGQAIGVLSAAAYASLDGTSFSAPLVAGAAAFLWRYHPAATFADVRVALLASAGVGGSAPRLDLWAALGELAAHGGPELGPRLADVDDGSVDGLLRTLPDGSAAPVVAPGDRGDGCVDIADFRAFRDALFDATAASGYAAFGAPATLHRDQNGDGVVLFSSAPTEARHSRFDLDGSGAIDAADLSVLSAHFGTCLGGAGPPVTEGFAASELGALLASVDLFLALPSGDGDLVLVAPGRAKKLIAAEEATARTVAGHLSATLPASVCDGGLDLRLERADGTVRLFATPAGEGLQLGRDYVLDGGVAGVVDRATPLVHAHTGPHVNEAIVYAATGEALAAADLEPPFLAAPTFADAAGGRHTRAAATETGGHVAVVTDGVVRSWKIAGTDSDLAALAWSADGQGLLLATTFGARRLFWLDLVREASAEVAPALAIGDAWPQIVDGFVVFASEGGLLMRAPTYAAGDWSASVTETAQCGSSYVLAAPEPLWDLTDFGPAADVTLPRAIPGALSERGDRLAFMVRAGDAWDLRVLSLDGPDAGRTLTIASHWAPRGGFETLALDASDGVAWSADGALLAYAMPDGVSLATLGTGELPAALGAAIKVHDAPAAIAFDPSGTSLLALVTEGPAQARTARLHVYRSPWGAAAVAIYPHQHRHGAVATSADGKQVAVVEADGSTKGDVVVYAPPGASPVSTTATWTDPCGAASCSTTSERMVAWARDLWPW